MEPAREPAASSSASVPRVPHTHTHTLQSPVGATPARSALAAARDSVAHTLTHTLPHTVTHTVKRSTRALQTLREEVARDAGSGAHSALAASQFNILDVYSSAAGEDELSSALRRVEEQEVHTHAALRERAGGTRSFCARCALRVRQRFVTFTTAPSSWVYLLVLGFMAAVVAFCVDAPVGALADARRKALGDHANAAYVIWLVWGVALTLVAAAIAHWVPMSEGSGIPQMKSILAGTELSHYLSLRVGMAKWAGLIAALGAGLSIGKEGPFVHIASCFASVLWRFPYFANIARNDSLRRQMLAAAVAAGVTGVFGTPVGGVLFSVEVTSTYFLTSSYWRCFLCAIVCRFSFDIMTALKQDSPFNPTYFDMTNLTAEVLAFAALGVICGLLGSLFVYTVNKIRIARKLIMTTAVRRYLLVAVCAAAIATLTYITPYLRKSDRDAINDLFSDGEYSSASMADWGAPNVEFSLMVFFGIKFVVTVLSISLPVACGLFIPMFVMGAAAGRLFGELLKLAWPSIVPGAYAVVGAAALTSGATQTVSTAVIVFELTGQLSHLLPVLLGTLVAYSVSGVFTISIYDLLLKLAGLPYLPRVYASDVYNLAARDVMHTDVRFLTLQSTYREAKALLSAPPYTSEGEGTVYAQRVGLFAVVESAENPVLVGAVSRATIESFFRRKRDAVLLRGGRPWGAAAESPGLQGLQPALEDVDGAAVPAAPPSPGYSAPRLVTIEPGPISPRGLPPAAAGEMLHADEGSAQALVGSALAVVPVQAGSSTARPPSLDTARVVSAAVHSNDGRGHSGNYVELRSPDRAVLQARPGRKPERGRAASASRAHGWRALSIFSPSGRQSYAALRGDAGEGSDNGSVTSPQGRNLLNASWLRTLMAAPMDLPDEAFDAAWLDSPIRFIGLQRRRGSATGFTSSGVSTSPAHAATTPPPASAADMLRIDPAPFQVSDMTPLPKVHYLFAICLFSELLVTRDGDLCGVIIKDDLSNPRRLSNERLTNSGSEDARTDGSHDV